MSHLADQLIEAAKVSRAQGRLSDALRDVSHAVELCRESGDRLRLVTSIKALGHIAAELKDYLGSRAAYAEAVELSRDVGTAQERAHSVRHLGDALYRLGDHDRAEASYKEALALYEGSSASFDLDRANALRSFAVLLDSTRRPAEAVQVWEEARGLYSAAGIQSGVSECAARLGE